MKKKLKQKSKPRRANRSTHSIAKKTPLPDSDSDSSNSSDSSDTTSSTQEKFLKSSTTSTSKQKDILSDANSNLVSKNQSKKEKNTAKIIPAAPLPPDPVLKGKRVNQTFSRIPKDTKVDDRLASNAYVPYDYAQKAHEDLVVTKGKGFTKEKNKKKRGSYRGGHIDIDGKKGIKFEN